MAKKKVNKPHRDDLTKVRPKKTKVTEVFEVEKKGKESIVEKKSVVETEVVKKGQKQHQDKLLKVFLGITIGIILLFVAGYFYIDSLKTSNYNGVEFTTIAEGDLIFYKTTVVTGTATEIINNNIYLRTKVKDLKKIPFNRDEFKLMKLAVLNYSSEFACDERKVIAEANLNHLHEVMGIQLIKDENATCDDTGRYSYYNFMESDTSEIERVGDNCYNIKVSSCELLPAMEKVMVEMILNYNSM